MQQFLGWYLAKTSRVSGVTEALKWVHCWCVVCIQVGIG